MGGIQKKSHNVGNIRGYRYDNSRSKYCRTMEYRQRQCYKRSFVMSLTGLQIFKYLPAAKKTEGTNCKKCGFPTCMAYALKLAKNQADITKCPYVPDELQSQFCEATKIQQHTINLS